jgi:hypothetical protein
MKRRRVVGESLELWVGSGACQYLGISLCSQTPPLAFKRSLHY